MSRIVPVGYPLSKAAALCFRYLQSLQKTIPCKLYSRSAFQSSVRHNDLPRKYDCRNISFFSKKKFKEDAEEVLKEKAEESGATIFAEEAAEKITLTEEEIERKRNKSGLRPNHYRALHGEVPYTEPKFWTHHTVAYKRRMYGIYGEKSGVNPGLMWPTKEDLAERLEYEQVAFPFTIQEMQNTIAKRRQLEKEEYEKRAQEVEKNMEMVDSIKAQILAKQRAKQMELLAAQERKEKLMEEVKRHFGYTIDTKDERFQEMLQKKEREQRKAMKEARKLAKQSKQLEKITQETESASKMKIDPLKKKKADNDDDDD